MKKTKINHYTDKEALEFHNNNKSGKIEIISSKPMTTKRDLALAYSPGVAAPVRAISENPDKAYDYTTKGNLVAVISNGSAILGMGNLGALASKPVMEGKAVLFKRFADIDSIDLEIDCSNADEIVNSIKNFAPSFGGINLEDIAAPDCFIIEQKLKENKGELVKSFIVEELPDTFNVMKDRWRHPKNWKESRERSSIRILCDTKDLPIYVDNQLVGKTPLEYAVDVLPGWHQVGYFPTDPALTPKPRSPKEKMMDNILRMGVLDVYVEEGKEQEIVLNYQNLDQDVLAFQRSISTGLSLIHI